MKKTLIALATLAAVSGTAFAQSTVTLSGAIGVGFNHTATGTTVDKTDAKVTFAVVEDLGAGLKVSGAFDLVSDARNTASTSSENITMALSGGFGTVDFKQLNAGATMLSGLESLPTDINAVMGGDTTIQGWGYTLPSLIQNVTLSVGGFETTTNTAFAGFSTSNVGKDAGKTSYTVAYANGPLAGSYSYRGADKRSRYIASYDFGVAKLQAGTDSNKQSEVVLTAPVGAFTFGYHYAKKNAANGTAVSAVYSLSKTTAVNFSMGNTTSGNTSRLKLTKAF